MRHHFHPVLLLVAALAAGLAAAQPGAATTKLQPIKGTVIAGDFVVKDLDGRRVRFRDFRGQVVLLNFWATWCPPCRKEMPSMERLHRAYAERGFTVVAVSVDTAAPPKIRAFLGQLEPAITFPVLHDRDSLVSRRYSVPGVPTSYLIDADGRIAYRALGEYDWFSPRAKEAVETLLNDAR